MGGNRDEELDHLGRRLSALIGRLIQAALTTDVQSSLEFIQIGFAWSFLICLLFKSCVETFPFDDLAIATVRSSMAMGFLMFLCKVLA